MKPFDEQFADNVRNAFDAWQEKVSEEAWSKMGSKLDGAKRPKIIPLWKRPSMVAAIALLAAASVALLVLPILLLKDNSSSERSPSIAEVSEIQTINQSELEIKPSPIYHENNSSDEPIYLVIDDKKIDSTSKPSDQWPVFAELQKDEFKPELTTDLVENEAPFQEPITPGEELATIMTDEVPLPLQEIEKAYVDDDLPFVANDFNEPELDFFFHDKPSPSRFSWAVSASPMIAFADNQVNPTPGLAAGITAGYNLSPRFRVEVGSMLAYNQLDIRNEATFSVIENFTNLYANQDASSPRLAFTGNNKYNLLALEIPANIQLDVFEGPKSKIFISTGLSSMIYLYQRVSGVNYVYVQQENTGLPPEQAFSSSTTLFVDNTYGPFSQIDLGRILNLSAGYVIVGKSNSIVLEPFLKLPLGNLSSSNLSLGMGGVSLKILFSEN